MKRERPTIMDGKVIDFAEEWKDEGPGIFGRNESPVGPYHISASRNAVIVHRAEFANRGDVDKFVAALREATTEAESLAARGWGNFKRAVLSENTAE